MEAKISIGDKIEISKIEKRLSVDPNKKVEWYGSQVLDEGEPNHYFVAMPIHEGKLIPFSVGQECETTFYTKAGLLQCKTLVAGRFKKGTLFLMEIELLTVPKKIQRREYFRYACRIPIEYRVIDETEKEIVMTGGVYKPENVQYEWKNGIMLDLSGGGIRFVSAGHEERGAILQLRFKILMNEMLDEIVTYAQLLRYETNANKETLFDNHLEFWEMNIELRERIIRYIFEEQRKNRSKQLGLQ